MHFRVATVGLILIATVVGAQVDHSLGNSIRITNGIGETAVDPMGPQAPAIAGYTMEQLDDVAIAKQFFGPQAYWTRFDYSAAKGTDSVERAQVDVVSTSDTAALQQYGIEACYNFHGFQLLSQHSIDLPEGLTAHVVSYRRSAATNWSAVWWVWRIATAPNARYERVVVISPSATNVPSLAPTTLRSDPTIRREIAAQEQRLITFSKSVLTQHLTAT